MSSRFARYLLWQVPGWITVAGALALLAWLAGLPAWLVPVGVAAVAVKDLAMYRVMRPTLDPPRARLLGARGRAAERLAPTGYVRVDGELWRAETSAGEIAAGTEIVVRELNGLTVRVEPVDPSP
jgi:membrane protein implicated in regulation of membrane protease activity